MAAPEEGVGRVIANGLETFETLEKLFSSEGRSVYKVVCKSGRLRNRHLALKKAPVSPLAIPPAKPEQPSWISLHQALHHPNIVSLLSVFSTTQETFYVLELCSAGDLAQFLHARSNHTLTEPELRGVCKNLVDALSYLRKESIIHRDINPSNILLTSAYRIKVSGFKHAIRLTSKHITAYPFSSTSDSNSYIAPEILSRRSHGFSADIWSLGCVMVYCLTGSTPCEADSMPLDPEKLKSRLPDHHSSDVGLLISGLLQIIPENRIHLPDMLSHNFFANGRPTTSLRCTGLDLHNLSNQSQDFYTSVKLPSYQSNRAERKTMRHVSDGSLHSFSAKMRTDPKETAKQNSGEILQSRPVSSDVQLSSNPTRRIVSDPVYLRSAGDPTKTSQSGDSDITVKSSKALFNRTMPVLNLHKDLEVPFAEQSIYSSQAQSKSSEAKHVGRDNALSAEYSQSRKRAAKLQVHDDQMTTDPSMKLPIGTGRPLAFSTTDLACQTHKTAHGQLTVLASHSLLVDFRESQRRKGMKGNEVLVIGPDGNKIAVYSAPHLSSPCCLIEPTREFSIHTLPQIYWKQYNDASRLVEQVKRRTPKIVLHSVRVKCTLMANTPQGDIEVLLRDPIALSSITETDRFPSVRVCFSRQDKSVEFARYNSGLQGEEWVKKVIPLTAGPPYISEKRLKDLRQDEKAAVQYLIHFVRICETLGELMSKAPTDAEWINPPMDQTRRVGSATVERGPQLEKTSISPCGISILNVAPRPSKISVITNTPGTDGSNIDKTTFSEQETDLKKGFFTITSAWRKNLNQVMTGQGVQSRFIPSVGWCVRYPSRVSQGGRYKILFLDGAALDIDIDEDWVEFRDTEGETTTYNIQDCGTQRKIGDRMEMFKDFVSLFDDKYED